MKYIILDWMDGTRTEKDTKQEILDEFDKQVSNAKKDNSELDISCFEEVIGEFDISCSEVLGEFNNIDGKDRE